MPPLPEWPLSGSGGDRPLLAGVV